MATLWMCIFCGDVVDDANAECSCKHKAREAREDRCTFLDVCDQSHAWRIAYAVRASGMSADMWPRMRDDRWTVAVSVS